jgi:hypothetical protein
MLPRHSNELLSRLEEVAEVGCGFIRMDLMLLWYGQERFTVGIWRDVQEKWEEVLDQFGEQKIPLLVGDSKGSWVFVWGEGLTTDSSWLVDVRDWAKRKAAESLTESA